MDSAFYRRGAVHAAVAGGAEVSVTVRMDQAVKAAIAAQKRSERVPGRLVVRRIPDFNAQNKRSAGQDTLFDVWRFHAFFTTADPAILDTVTADKTHRGHAIIEQVHADLKNSALAHLSGVFTANAA